MPLAVVDSMFRQFLFSADHTGGLMLLPSLTYPVFPRVINHDQWFSWLMPFTLPGPALTLLATTIWPRSAARAVCAHISPCWVWAWSASCLPMCSAGMCQMHWCSFHKQWHCPYSQLLPVVPPIVHSCFARKSLNQYLSQKFYLWISIETILPKDVI